MAAQTNELWTLVRGRPEVDPGNLADAIQDLVVREPLDYRTRLLIRDSIEALKAHWGAVRWQAWLEHCPARAELQSIGGEHFDAPGFPSLGERLMEKTDPLEVQQFLRELGSQISRPVRLNIGGSIALIMPGYLSRHTEDIDVVDEVPAEVRSLHSVRAQLKKRYGLAVAHFQSHYLPSGWQMRLHSLGQFGQIQVYLVDAGDIFLCKLFSKRDKDLDDLRMLAPQLDKEHLVRRLTETTASFLADPTLRQQAIKNWYIVYGETLPS